MINPEQFGFRLKMIRQKVQMNQDEFSKILELTQASYSQVEKGKNMVSMKVLNNLIENIPVNINFLFTGEEPMFTSDKCPPKFVHLSRENVHLIKNTRTLNRVDTPDTSSGNILVPAPALASYAIGWPDEYLEDQIQYVNIPGIQGEARTFQVSGDSMASVLTHGDYVSCTPVVDIKNLKEGKIYVVITSDSGIYIKYIQLYEMGLLLASENHTEFEPVIIPYSSIKEIWQAKVRITSSFLPYHINPSSYFNIERVAKIENFLSKKFPNFKKSK